VKAAQIRAVLTKAAQIRAVLTTVISAAFLKWLKFEPFLKWL